MRLYRLYDPDPQKHPGVFQCSFDEAKEFNKNNWGIFWTVNDFDGPRRIENLKKIQAWYCEIDSGNKKSQFEKLVSCIPPSLLVETKRGFHCYWKAESATFVRYEAIQERIIEYFGADKGVKDVTRILRAPGFYHWKNINEPFLIKEVLRTEYSYNEYIMERFFRTDEKQEEKIIQKQIVRDALSNHGGHATWSYFIDMNQMDGLKRLSGTSEVYGEKYNFIKNSKNEFQIIVNNKRSQCWIDSENKIGSHTKGGPTIFNWLRWFGYSNSEVASILRKYFPEGFKK